MATLLSMQLQRLITLAFIVTGITLLGSLFHEKLTTNLIVVESLNSYIEVIEPDYSITGKFCEVEALEGTRRSYSNNNLEEFALASFYISFATKNCHAIADTIKKSLQEDPRDVTLFWLAITQMEIGETKEAASNIGKAGAENLIFIWMLESYTLGASERFFQLLAIVADTSPVFAFVDREARSIYATGDIMGATKFLDSYLAMLTPDSLLFFRTTGLLKRMERNLDEAIYQLSRAVEQYPDDAYLRNELYEAYIEAGQFQNAEIAARSLIAISADSRAEYWAYLKVATSYRLQGNYKDAEVWVRKAIQLDANWWPAYRDLGIIKCAQADADQSIQAFDRAVDLEPLELSIMIARATCLYQLGDVEDALNYSHYIISEYQSNPLVIHMYTRLGQWYVDQGNTQAALDLYEEALMFWPNAHWIRSRVQQLD
jgi:tetratricopeptide (TPR) repeat protein